MKREGHIRWQTITVERLGKKKAVESEGDRERWEERNEESKGAKRVKRESEPLDRLLVVV